MALEPFTDGNGNLLPGYRAYNGYVFTAADCRVYNDHTARVERAACPARIEQERNSRHMAFCLITGCNG